MCGWWLVITSWGDEQDRAAHDKHAEHRPVDRHQPNGERDEGVAAGHAAYCGDDTHGERVVRDGRTFRAYLDDDIRQIIVDPETGGYMRTVECAGLYEWFAELGIRLKDYALQRLTKDDLEGLDGRAIMQAKAMDGLQRSLDELGAISHMLDGDRARGEAVDRLAAEVERNVERMQALVAAIAETPDKASPSTISSVSFIRCGPRPSRKPLPASGTAFDT